MVEIKRDWGELRDRWARQELQVAFRDALGPASRNGMAFRWGIAAATGLSCDDELQLLSLYASDSKVPKNLRQIEMVSYLRQWQERLVSCEAVSMVDAAFASVVATALPRLQADLSLDELAEVGESLVSLHDDSISHPGASDPRRLLLGAELGWMLHCLHGGSLVSDPDTTPFGKQSTDAILQWCATSEDSIPQAIQGGQHLRLILASLVRCKKLGLLRGVSKSAKTQWKEVGNEIARWVLAFSGHRGQAGFSAADAAMLRDDLETDGLLDQAVKFDRDTLTNAKDFRGGKGSQGCWFVVGGISS